MLKVHHLNCGSLCSVGMKMLYPNATKMVCHVLLIETNDGLVLVDTGFGAEDIRSTKTRLGSAMSLFISNLQMSETAIVQIENLGFKASDVRHIVPTHMDFDHIGGISDFPNAIVHILKDEYDCANGSLNSLILKNRYRPVQWATCKTFKFYSEGSGDKWFGFDAVRDLDGLTSDILLVPIRGHTAGHTAVAVKQGDQWLLHCGDGYFSRVEMSGRLSPVNPLELFQRTIAFNNDLRLKNADRVRELVLRESNVIKAFSAHDELEWKGFL